MLKIRIPIKTVSVANLREHWAVKSKRQKQHRLLIKLFCSHLISPKLLPCRVTLTRIAPRKLDSDNAVMAFKGIKDLIADLLVPGLAFGRADDDPRIEWDYAQVKGDAKEYAIEIFIAPKNFIS